MKKFYILLLLAFLWFFQNANTANSQMPSFMLSVKNIHLTADSLLVFDIYLADVSAGAHDPFNYAAGAYHMNYNTGIGTGLVLKKIGSDLPSGNQCPTFSTAAGRLSCSPNIPANNNIIIPSTLPGIKVLSLELETSLQQFNQVPMNLVWRTAAPAPFTKVSYFDPNGMVVEIPVSSNNSYNIDDPNFIPISQLPITNFTASSTNITPGSSTNFIDLSQRNPTSWSWSFPGGTPSSSTQQNPSGIVYNTPGVYSVSLTATNSFGSNTLTKTDYITVSSPSPTCPIIWQNFVKITDAANFSDTIMFGTSIFATDGVDTCLGEVIVPPTPPTGVFDVRFQLPSPFTDGVKRDFRRDSVEITLWKIKFQESTSGAMSFKWDSVAFPQTGNFFLKDAITGQLVNVNMKNQSSYVLPSNLVSLHELIIEYKFFATSLVSVRNNWNIISVPLLSQDMHLNVLFPGAGSPSYWFNGNGYITSDPLVNGKGYWVKFSQDTTYRIQGLKVSPQQIPVLFGWNMIGPFDENMVVSQIASTPPGIIISPFYGYENGYVIEDTLKAGKGYWIRTSAAGVLFESGSDNLPVSTEGNDLSEFTKIEIFGNGQSSQLYLARSYSASENFDLPPVPPAGIFDVRFSTDKLVESYGHNNIIKINSAIGELRFKISNLGENKLRLKDGLTGSLLNIVLLDNSEVVIPANLNNLVLIDESQIPDTYSLGQNYPNPFNPVTSIDFQIPKEGLVKIVLYDVLGKEVQTLVNENLSAGQYKTKFNAINVASGIYFYKMSAGEYSDIKRMIIIK